MNFEDPHPCRVKPDGIEDPNPNPCLCGKFFLFILGKNQATNFGFGVYVFFEVSPVWLIKTGVFVIVPRYPSGHAWCLLSKATAQKSPTGPYAFVLRHICGFRWIFLGVLEYHDERVRGAVPGTSVSVEMKMSALGHSPKCHKEWHTEAPGRAPRVVRVVGVMHQPEFPDAKMADPVPVFGAEHQQPIRSEHHRN